MTDPLHPAQMAKTHRLAFSLSRPWSEQEFAELLQSPLVFACGTERCFALVRVIAEEAELLTLATRPDSQRRGLAKQVMAIWQQSACKKGALEAFLEVAADNQAALSLYTSCGYKEAGRRSGYYPRPTGSAVDAIVMRRALP